MERFNPKKDYTRYLNKKVVKHKKRFYNDTIICLDVETTSAYLDVDTQEIIAFDKSKKPDFYKSFKKINLLYEWTFGIEDNIVIYGRTLDEMGMLFRQLQKSPINYIIWAHNLSYEFMFILNVLDIKDVFARKAHRIMYARSGNLEFRCTYMLTRLSLASWGKQENISKLTDNYNYDLIRTPYTPLTAHELRYCEHDILIMVKGLKRYRTRYGGLAYIPLTQTGEVRRDVKNLFKDDFRYHQTMTKLLPDDAAFYNFLLQVFMGGYTHASYFYSGVLHRMIKSKDLTSAYPAEMALSKFPVTPWNELCPSLDNYRKYNNDNHSLLLEVELYGVKAKGYNTYIPYSKHQGIKKYRIDNGRIIDCEYVKLSITNLDLDIIESMYTVERIQVNKLYMARNGYLNKKLVMYVLERFKGKNELADVEGMEDLYLADKQRLNSIFGLMVQKLIELSIIFDLQSEKVWKTEIPNCAEIDKHLQELKEKPYKNFLSYSQGIFITAKVRKVICTIISKMDIGVLYSDTDAIKYKGDYDFLFEEYNSYNMKRIKEVSKKRNIDMSYFMPLDIHGKPHILGNFEDDKGTPYQEFKTQGAKRYAYRDNKGECHITVSGVNKEHGVKALKDCIDNFKNEMVFDYDEAKKGMLTYIYDMPQIVWKKGQPDEYTSTQQYGVHMQSARYVMSLSTMYADLLKSVLRHNI